MLTTSCFTSFTVWWLMFIFYLLQVGLVCFEIFILRKQAAAPRMFIHQITSHFQNI